MKNIKKKKNNHGRRVERFVLVLAVVKVFQVI